MKAILFFFTVIVLILSLNSASAWAFDCSMIQKKITHYPIYKTKVEKIFKDIQTKPESVQDSFYTKIDKVTSLYSDKAPIGSKIHTVLWYLYCKNTWFPLNNDEQEISCSITDLKLNIDIEKYWKIQKVTTSDDWRETLVTTAKWQMEKCSNCYEWQEFVWMHYLFYYKDGQLIESRVSKNYYQAWFINWNKKYVISYEWKKWSLHLGDSEYSIDGSINLSGKNFMFSWKKEKVLFNDGTFSKEYDAIFSHKSLDNGDKILLVWEWKRPQWMWENFIWKHFVVKNWMKTEIKDIQYFHELMTCKNTYWYVYTDNNSSAHFIFWGKTYWIDEPTAAFNIYGYKENTCVPLYLQIWGDGKWNFWTRRLFLWDSFIFEAKQSLWSPQLQWDNIYFTLFEWTNGKGWWYKLYKNWKKIESRWWLKKYWFLKNEKLVYATTFNWNTIIKEWSLEKNLPWVKWTDDLYISNNKKSYAFGVRSNSSNNVFSNWSLIESNRDFVNWVYIKDKFLSVHEGRNGKENALFFDNKEITNFSWNAHSLMNRDKKNLNSTVINLEIDWKHSIVECK